VANSLQQQMVVLAPLCFKNCPRRG